MLLSLNASNNVQVTFNYGPHSAGATVKNLAPNVNLSYCMDLWSLGSKLQKNCCWTFSR